MLLCVESVPVLSKLFNTRHFPQGSVGVLQQLLQSVILTSCNFLLVWHTLYFFTSFIFPFLSEQSGDHTTCHIHHPLPDLWSMALVSWFLALFCHHTWFFVDFATNGITVSHVWSYKCHSQYCMGFWSNFSLHHRSKQKGSILRKCIGSSSFSQFWKYLQEQSPQYSGEELFFFLNNMRSKYFLFYFRWPKR